MKFLSDHCKRNNVRHVSSRMSRISCFCLDYSGTDDDDNEQQYDEHNIPEEREIEWGQNNVLKKV